MNKLSLSHYWMIALLVTATFFLPSLLTGVRESHDAHHHLSWYLSFRDAFGFDNLYPRWLPTQYDGLGSPVMYFYPPLTNYFYSLIDFLTARLIPTDHLLVLSAILMAFAAMGSFYLWIKNHTTEKIAIAASVLFAVSPYHVAIDFYTRTAMAEFAAYIWIPLIFAGIYHLTVHADKRWAVFLCLSITALFLTHLLTALIIAPVAIAYAIKLILEHRDVQPKIMAQRIAFMAAAGFVALALSGIYLFPALKLFDVINTDALHHFPLRKGYLFFALIDPSPNDHFMLKLFIIGTVNFILSLFFFKSARFWCICAVITYAIMNKACEPLFLSPSPYREIQFPWRLLSLMEFLTLTGAAISLKDGSRRLHMLCGALFGCLLLLQSADITHRFLEYYKAPSALTWVSSTKRMGPPEYLPKNAYEGWSPGIPDFVQKYSDRPLATIPFKKLDVKLDAIQKGTDFSIPVKSPVATTVTIHQFYFPGWEALDEKGETLKIGMKDYLVAIDVPAGEHVVDLHRVKLPEEKIGQHISLVGLALFAVLFLASFRYKKPS